MKCYYTAIQIPEIKKKNAMFEAFGTHTLPLRVQTVQQFRKRFQPFLTKLNLHLPYDLVIPLLCIFQEKLKRVQRVLKNGFGILVIKAEKVS